MTSAKRIVKFVDRLYMVQKAKDKPLSIRLNVPSPTETWYKYKHIETRGDKKESGKMQVTVAESLATKVTVPYTLTLPAIPIQDLPSYLLVSEMVKSRTPLDGLTKAASGNCRNRVGESEIADAIRQRRKNGKLIALDGVLLNAPSIASGYSQLLGAVRTKNNLNPVLRKLLHVPIGREAGLTEEQIEWIRDISSIRTTEVGARPVPPAFFPPVMQTALTYTDCMTVDIKVPASVFAALKGYLSDQQLTEVTATIASYNMVSRILVALDVEDMADKSI
ncbi:hypothetical protein Clacol_010282 [Clathrus columnatus]|uniref:Vitellogenin n=1 Tax=Clathrus columnatus TaxID=1419009 RepID=A0AAV5ATN9_9AGAM|nr:hypothetical protein Clacol_010282 [Clathrus columnatus]